MKRGIEWIWSSILMYENWPPTWMVLIEGLDR